MIVSLPSPLCDEKSHLLQVLVISKWLCIHPRYVYRNANIRAPSDGISAFICDILSLDVFILTDRHTGMSPSKSLILAITGLFLCLQLYPVKGFNCNDICLRGIVSESCNCNVKLPFRWGKRSTLRLPFRFGKRSSIPDSYSDERWDKCLILWHEMWDKY